MSSAQNTQSAVYILANQRQGALYVGVTDNLAKKIWQHKNELVPGFSLRFRTFSLVHYEFVNDNETAVGRQKELRAQKHASKIKLIEERNPEWQDLYANLFSPVKGQQV